MVFTALFFLFHVLYVVFDLFVTHSNPNYAIHGVNVLTIVNMFDVIVLLVLLVGGLFLIFNSPSINQVFDLLSFLIFSYLFPLPQTPLSNLTLFNYIVQNFTFIIILLFVLSTLGLWVIKEGVGGKE